MADGSDASGTKNASMFLNIQMTNKERKKRKRKNPGSPVQISHEEWIVKLLSF